MPPVISSVGKRTSLNQRATIFLLCCELKSFSQAAQVLQITQPAVSKAIKTYEDELGFPLFYRSRPLRPTPQAERLYKKLSELSSEYSDFLQDLSNGVNKKPLLKLGMLESLSVAIGADLCMSLEQQYSQVILTSGSANVLLPRLQNGDADIILTNNLYSNTERMSRRRVFDEPTVLIFPKGYIPEHHPSTRSWKELSKLSLPFIGYWNDCGAGQVNNVFLKSRGVSLEPEFAVDCNMVLLTMVAKGAGWGLARPTVILENRALLELIDIYPSPLPVLYRSVFLMWIRKEFDEEADRLLRLIRIHVRDILTSEIEEICPWVPLKVREE